MTAPVQFDPQDVRHWFTVLRNAAMVPKGDPRYDDARDVVEQALEQIQHLNRTANQEDRLRAGPKEIPGDAALGVGLMHSLSLRAGEPIAGFINKLRGGSFAEGAASYREGLGEVGAQNPTLEPLGEVFGLLAPAAVPARTALLAARAPASTSSNLLSAARTVGEGATIGGIAGYSAGGDDPGDMDARLRTAGRDAAISGLLAGLFGAALARARRGAPPPSPSRDLPEIDMDLTPAGLPGLKPRNRPVAPMADPMDVPTFVRSGKPIPETPGVSPPSVVIEEFVRRLAGGRRRRRAS